MRVIGIVKETFKRWLSHNPDFLAAGIAYFAFFSVVPLMLLAAHLTRLLLGYAYNQAELLVSLERWMGPRVLDGLSKWLALGAPADASGIGTVIGGIGLFFAASYVFIQLESALHTLWDVPPAADKTFKRVFHSRFKSFIFTLTLCGLILLSLFGEAGLSILIRLDPQNNSFGIQLMQFLLSIVMFNIFFTLLMRFVPRIKLSWKSLWLGGSATSLLFAIGKIILGYYVAWSNMASAQGVAGSILVFLLWVYISVLIFLWGASLSKVLSDPPVKNRKI